jgi:tetratricopeptide (TPR) repeat protein
MKLFFAYLCWATLGLSVALPAMGQATQPSTNTSPVSLINPAPPPPAPAAETVPALLHDAYVQVGKGELDAGLAKVNAALQMDPKNAEGYLLRASIYTRKKQSDDAERDYETARGLVPISYLPVIDFFEAEVKFAAKDYAAARPGFAALQNNKDLADIASYKVFLCDLLGGQEDVAAKELGCFQ